MKHFRRIMKIVGTVVDAAGVLIIIVGALLASGRFCLQRTANAYRQYQQDLGREILLGLDSSSQATSSEPSSSRQPWRASSSPHS